MVGDSLEWLTCKSDLVVAGRIEKIVSTVDATVFGTPVHHEITLVVKETVKGKAKGRIVVHFSSFRLKGDAVLAAGMRSPEPTLFFLTKGKAGKLKLTTSEPVDPVFDLAHPVRFAFDATGKGVLTKEAIMKLCRETDKKMSDHLKVHPNGRVAEKRVGVNYDTAAGKALYAGSATYLRVPDFMTEERK
jgi:hypothetical protein